MRYQGLNASVIARESTSVPGEARAEHRLKNPLVICGCVQMWELEDRAKSSSLSLNRRKQSI